MVVSYILGQTYYPIKYNLRKFFLYLFSAIGLFFLAGTFEFETGSIAQISVNNSLILLYLGLIWFIEKPLKKAR